MVTRVQFIPGLGYGAVRGSSRSQKTSWNLGPTWLFVLTSFVQYVGIDIMF